MSFGHSDSSSCADSVALPLVIFTYSLHMHMWRLPVCQNSQVSTEGAPTSASLLGQGEWIY